MTTRLLGCGVVLPLITHRWLVHQIREANQQHLLVQEPYGMQSKIRGVRRNVLFCRPRGKKGSDFMRPHFLRVRLVIINNKAFNTVLISLFDSAAVMFEANCGDRMGLFAKIIRYLLPNWHNI